MMKHFHLLIKTRAILRAARLIQVTVWPKLKLAFFLTKNFKASSPNTAERPLNHLKAPHLSTVIWFSITTLGSGVQWVGKLFSPLLHGHSTLLLSSNSNKPHLNQLIKSTWLQAGLLKQVGTKLCTTVGKNPCIILLIWMIVPTMGCKYLGLSLWFLDPLNTWKAY